MNEGEKNVPKRIVMASTAMTEKKSKKKSPKTGANQIKFNA